MPILPGRIFKTCGLYVFIMCAKQTGHIDKYLAKQELGTYSIYLKKIG